MPYLSASAVVIHYEEALYQVYVPVLPFTLSLYLLTLLVCRKNGKCEYIDVSNDGGE